MASASCSMTVTELEMKLIVPHRKFVPMFSSAAAPKVMRRTGTSA